MRKNGTITKSVLFALSLLLIASCGGRIKIKKPDEPVRPGWTQLGGGKQRSSSRQGPDGNTPVFVKKLKPASMIGKSLVAGDNTLFCPTLKGDLEAYRFHDFEFIGRLKIGEGLISSPVYRNRRIFFASSKGDETLFGYDLKRGRYLWKKGLGVFESSLALSDGMLFAANRSGIIHALDTLSGEIRWQFDTGEEIIADLLTDDGRIYAGTIKGTVYALDVRSGAAEWQYETGLKLMAGPSTDGKRLFWGTLDDVLIALNAATGGLEWKFETGGPVYAPPAVYGGCVYFGSNDNHLYAVGAADGKERWRFDSGAVINTHCVVLNGRVYFGALNKKIFGLDTASGEIRWEYEAEGRIISNPLFYSDNLIFPVEHRYLYFFRFGEGS